jgi:hypothetical protein
MLKSPNRFWIAALLIAWAVDFFFYGKQPGLSFLLWNVLLIGGTLFLARSEQVRVPPLSLLLAGFILLLAAVPFIRREPFTLLISAFLALALAMVLAATLRSASWPYYRVWDYLAAGFWLVIASLSRPFTLSRDVEAQEGGAGAARRSGFWRGAAPVLRGLLIALPIVALLAALLSSADLIFAQRLEKFLDLLNIERLPEYIFRLFYILVLGYVFAGALAHAVHPRKEVARPQNPNQPVIKPFLGWTEAGMVLASVDALFLFFVVLQVQYLFGGEANITATGFTYSEYARRGFSELVAVAVISLLLYLGLGEIARRETPGQRRAFSLLSVLLMAQVLVILASAFQRLLLYETAYGFTRLRTYTFFFIPWLALLLLATIVLELIRQPGRFGPALLLTALGFGLTFGAINVDGLIVRQNIQRTAAGEELDVVYLTTLSSDAVPALVDKFREPSIPVGIRADLGAVLACRQALLEDQPTVKWQEVSLSAVRAGRLLEHLSAELRAFPVWQENGVWQVRVDGISRNCFGDVRID